MVAKRLLDGFELACALTGERAVMNLVTVLRLRPAPARAEVEPALERVRARHPLLRAAIVREGRSRRFAPVAGPIPLRAAAGSGSEAWRPVAERELAVPFGEGEAPLARAVLVGEGASEGALVVTFHHAVIDGTGAIVVLDEILAALDGRAGQGAPEAEPLPPPATAGFPEPWSPAAPAGRRRRALAAFAVRQLAAELAYRLPLRRRPSPAPPPPAFHSHTVRIAPAAAERLAAACRGARLTLHSVLQAALLLAAVRRIHGGRGGRLRAMAFPDLRPKLRPRTPPSAVVNHATVVSLIVEVRRRDALFTVARRVQRALANAFRRGDRFGAALLAPRLISAALGSPRRRIADTALSYSGAIDLPHDPGAGRFRDLHAMVTNLSQGPPLTAQARWLRGALTLDLVTLAGEIGPERTAELGDEIRELLERRNT